jgi:phage-related protein
MPDEPIKPVSWIGASYKDFRAFPDPVQDTKGYALYRPQVGAKHESAKPLMGFGGAEALEIVADHVGETFAPPMR